MNWTAIAALAQVLAAIGVIVSVVYLALQVRQNTHQARLNTESLGVTHEMGGAAMSIDIGLAIAGDAELADILQRANAGGESLSAADKIRFSAFLYASVAGFQAGFYNFRRGFADPEAWRGHERDVVGLLASPMARAWWEREQLRFSPKLVDHLDRLLAAEPQLSPSSPPDADKEEQ
ncbi:MAG: hypothetical protein PVF05_00760 [Gemmatimonadales bacterium]|jgi:hypothetical protein